MNVSSPMEGAKGVFAIGSAPSLPRPHVGIVGGLHGNEPCGFRVVQGLRDPEHPLRRRLKKGTLFLIHGNPEATAQNARHTRDGADLNRLFNFDYINTLPRKVWKYEHRRALELKPVVEALDAILDLHSCTAPSTPFVITSGAFLPLASRLGCTHLTYGWERPGMLNDQIMNGLLLRRGRPAIAVECGQHDAPDTFARAWEVTESFLSALGLLESPVPIVANTFTCVEALYRIRKPSADFVFKRDFVGFDELRTGEFIGEGGGVRLTASDDYRVLLPNDRVGVGEDMLYLGKARELKFGISPGWCDHPNCPEDARV